MIAPRPSIATKGAPSRQQHRQRHGRGDRADRRGRHRSSRCTKTPRHPAPPAAPSAESSAGRPAPSASAACGDRATRRARAENNSSRGCRRSMSIAISSHQATRCARGHAASRPKSGTSGGRACQSPYKIMPRRGQAADDGQREGNRGDHADRHRAQFETRPYTPRSTCRRSRCIAVTTTAEATIAVVRSMFKIAPHVRRSPRVAPHSRTARRTWRAETARRPSRDRSAIRRDRSAW